jgi:nucleoside-diphosphate-sugar epimerase
MKIAVLGATGRTGRLIVEQALAQGHEVRALARSPNKLALQHPKLESVRGDVHEPSIVRDLVRGCDVVISALGVTETAKDVCSVGAANVIAAKPKRYVVISGAGIDFPGDRKNLPGKIGAFLVRTLAPEMFQDKVREAALLQQSDVPFVIVRPPLLVDGPSKGPARTSTLHSPGPKICRTDLAAFALRCALDDSFLRKAPFVAN